MSTPRVYEGGLPGTYDSDMKNAGFGISGEGESAYVPGKVDAPSPKTVKSGASGGEKTYDKKASEDFLGNSSYQTFNMATNNWTSMGTDIDNPDDLSHSDKNDDSDLPAKGN